MLWMMSMNKMKVARASIRTNLIILAVLLVSSLFIRPAAANTDVDKFGLDLNLGSYHLKRCYSNCTKKFNEFNYGLTGTYRPTEHIELWAGFVRNSFNQSSKFGVINFNNTYFTDSKIKLIPGIGLGFVDGYGNTPVKVTFGDTGIAPIVMPNLTIQKNHHRLNVGLTFANTTVITVRAGLTF